MASAKLNEASLEKKLYHAEPTQQGIQALTKWITGHKDHYQKIVELWRKILKKSQPKHRLTLFYVANDVVQYARRKKVNDLYAILKGAISDVVPLLREDSIIQNVQRVLTVWLDRDIFEGEYVQELRDSLDKQKIQAAQNAKIVERFKPSEMTDKIREMMTKELENEKKLKMLKLVKVDVSSPEAIQQIKDRMHGTKHCNDFEDACSKLEDYVSSLAQQIQIQKDVQERLVQSEVYYEHQYGEAKIVANAYKNFSLRVNNLRKRLAEFIKILPDPEEPEPEALSPEYEAPSPGNTPPPDLTKDHIMDEHMDLSDGDEQEPNLVFENEKSSPAQLKAEAEENSDGEGSTSDFDVDALLEKEFDNSPQATPSQKSKRPNKSMEPQSPPPAPRPQHPAVASFLNTSYKTETRSSSANSSPGRNGEPASARNPPSALDKRLAALTAKGGETMMSLFGGLNETLDGDGDEVCSNASGKNSPTRGEDDDDDEDGENAEEKSGVKRAYAFSPDPNGGGDLTPTRDESDSERPRKILRSASPEDPASAAAAAAAAAASVSSKGPHTPVGPHTPSGSEPQTPTTSTEGTPIRAPFFPPGAPVPPTPPPSLAMFNSGIQPTSLGTPPPRQPQPPVFKSLNEDSVPPLPPPPPFPFFNLGGPPPTSTALPASSSVSASKVETPSPVISQIHQQQQQQQQQQPHSPANPQLQHPPPPQSPATPHLQRPAPQAATPLSLSQPSLPMAPSLSLPLSAPAIPAIPLSLPASVAQVVQVGAAAIPGGVETPASAAKFDKSDEVLFKAQDEFLRRLKEKSAKGTTKPSPAKLSAVAGMTMALPPKPTKSPPPSFADEAKDEKHETDVDMRLGNLDLKKLKKDIDAIVKKDPSQKEPEEILVKNYQPDPKRSSPETDVADEKTNDVDMRRDKAKDESHGGETRKKRLSIVRPPPCVVSRPSTSASSSHGKEEPPEARRRGEEPPEARRRSLSSTSSSDDKRKFEGESSDGRGESQASSSRGDSRSAAGEKESVWRRLSAETFSQRDSKEGRVDKDTVRRYSEMCDNYYRTYYEEQYGKGKKYAGAGSEGGSSSSSSGRRHEDDHHEHHHHDRHHDDHHHHHDEDDRRSSSKRRHR